jgi:phage-related protein
VAEPVAATPLISQTDFKNYMTAIRAFTLTQPGHPFPLPTRLMHPIYPPLPKIITPNLQSIANAAQAAANSWVAAQQTAATQAVQNLQNTNNTGSFDQQIGQARQNAVNQATTAINNYYDTLQNAGDQDPSLQSQILQMAQKSGSFWSSLLQSVGDFFDNLVQQVEAWVQQVVQWVENAVQAIANWVSSAVQSIGKFFSSLF